jgi:hypothetical protein
VAALQQELDTATAAVGDARTRHQESARYTRALKRRIETLLSTTLDRRVRLVGGGENLEHL